MCNVDESKKRLSPRQEFRFELIKLGKPGTVPGSNPKPRFIRRQRCLPLSCYMPSSGYHSSHAMVNFVIAPRKRITIQNRLRCRGCQPPRVLYCRCRSAAILQDAARLIRVDDDLKQEWSIPMVYDKAVMHHELVVLWSVWGRRDLWFGACCLISVVVLRFSSCCCWRIV